MHLELNPLPLRRHTPAGPVQVVALTVTTLTPVAAEVALAQGAATTRHALEIPAGTSQHRLEVPAVTHPTHLRAKIETPAGPATTETVLEPVRPWTVYLVHHTHVDLGYTDPQSRIVELHKQYLDHVLQYCRRTADWPADSRFRWNVEVTWPLMVWLQDRPAAVRDEFVHRVRQGQIEVTAFAFNVHSETCAPEELARLLYDAGKLRRDLGIPVTSAIQSDIPGLTWLVPQVLNSAGIRYLALAPNNWRAPFHAGRAGHVPRPFWWEGRDGSRVLTWFTDAVLDGYQEGNLTGFTEDYGTVLERLPDRLLKLEREGYPYHLLHLRCQGGYADNGAPNLRISEIVRSWNEVWEYPRVTMARNSDFFTAMEQACGGQIPAFRVDWPDWWVDGVGSAARELGLVREAHERLLAAEGLHALLAAERQPQDPAGEARPGGTPAHSYPSQRLSAAWEQVLLFDEHTWGSALPAERHLTGIHSGGVQWAVKAGMAHAALDQSRRLEEAALAALSASVQTGPDPVLIIHNSLGWNRSMPVELYLMDLRQWCPGAPGVDLYDLTTGGAVVTQLVSREPAGWDYHAKQYRDRLVFLAEDVPAYGYKCYALRPGAGPTAAATTAADPPVLETDRYRVEVDLGRAGIARIRDKRLERELVAPGQILNRYIRQEYIPSEDQRLQEQTLRSEAMAEGAVLNLLETGPVMLRAQWTVQAPGTAGVTTEVALWRGLDRIDISNRVHKTGTMEKEGIYIAFPLNVPQFRTHLQIPGAEMAPREEQLPGSCPDWYCVQHGIDLSGPDGGVYWATVEAPLVELGAITTAMAGRGGPVAAPTIYSYAMNNLWSTNFAPSQDGEVSLRYAVAAHAGPHDPTALLRFGAEASRAPGIGWAGANRSGSRTAASGSLLSITPENVNILGLKQAEDGNGLIVRLCETSGQPADARLSLPAAGITAARTTDLLEQDQNDLPTVDGSVSVPVPPYGLVTVRLMSG